MNRILLLSCIILINCLSALGQNGTYSIDRNTNKISDYKQKIQFNYVGAYDNDLNEWRTDHPPYRAVTNVVINIGSDGKGKIFTSQYGHEKVSFPID